MPNRAYFSFKNHSIYVYRSKTRWATRIKRTVRNVHCVKSVRIRSFSGPYPVRMRKNTDQKNSEYGHLYRTTNFKNRPNSLKDMCYADFAATYDCPKGDSDEEFDNDGDALSDREDISNSAELPDKIKLKKWK